MGNDALDLAREKFSKMSTETREPDLSEMPLQSAFLVFGTTALFLGLGRLPGIFFLIGGAVLMVSLLRSVSSVDLTTYSCDLVHLGKIVPRRII